MKTREQSTVILPHRRLSLQELSGSLGDLGTFLPLTLAMAVACGVPLAASFFFAGLAHLVTAWRYPIPIPVQPMKAIAAIAISGGLTAEPVTMAGLLLGVAMLALAAIGAAERLQHAIPLAVVRGLQLGLGAVLAWQGVAWLLPALADSQAVWVIAALALAAAGLRWRLPSALLIVLGGAVWVWPQWRVVGWEPWWPSFALPALDAWRDALPLAVVQLPTTLLNSVIAVIVLARDLFPRLPAGVVTAGRLCTTVGGLNLLGGFLGGAPVCHGSGGLAAQYRFGARSNVALWLLGTIKIALALATGGTLAALVAVYPKPLLGVLVLVSGLELMRMGLRHIALGAYLATALVAIGVILQQTLLAVALGWFVQWALARRRAVVGSA